MKDSQLGQQSGLREIGVAKIHNIKNPGDNLPLSPGFLMYTARMLYRLIFSIALVASCYISWGLMQAALGR